VIILLYSKRDNLCFISLYSPFTHLYLRKLRHLNSYVRLREDDHFCPAPPSRLSRVSLSRKVYFRHLIPVCFVDTLALLLFIRFSASSSVVLSRACLDNLYIIKGCSCIAQSICAGPPQHVFILIAGTVCIHLRAHLLSYWAHVFRSLSDFIARQSLLMRKMRLLPLER